MEVSYTLTRDELKRALQFLQSAAGGSVSLWRVLPILVAMVGFAAITLHSQLPATPRRISVPRSSLHSGPLSSPTAQLLLTALPLLLFAFFYIVARHTNDPGRQNPELLKPQTIGIAPNGFYVRTSKEDVLRRWDGLLKIEENDEFILVMVNKQGANIIPKRAFSSPEAAQQFLTRARELFDHARGPQPPIPPPRENA